MALLSLDGWIRWHGQVILIREPYLNQNCNRTPWGVRRRIG